MDSGSSLDKKSSSSLRTMIDDSGDCVVCVAFFFSFLDAVVVDGVVEFLGGRPLRFFGGGLVSICFSRRKNDLNNIRNIKKIKKVTFFDGLLIAFFHVRLVPFFCHCFGAI